MVLLPLPYFLTVKDTENIAFVGGHTFREQY